MAEAIIALSVAALVAYLLTPTTGRLAIRFGVIDHPSVDPEGYKQHAAPTPYLGGLAIFLGLIAGASVAFITTDWIPIRNFALTIGAGLGLGVLGLLDDIRPLPRTLRLAGQVLVAVAAWELGFGVGSTPFDALNMLLTVLWIVGVTNAFNLLDNMDGVSAGLAGIASLSFAAIGLLADLPVLPVVSAALAGASFGFLIHNRHPARVFMGDAGSMFLGFLVALIGIRLRFENLPSITFMVPVVVLGLPILDTALVVISRLKHKRPVFLGGRDHIAHRLVYLGLPIRSAVRLMYLVAVCLGWIGLVITRSNQQVGFMLLGFVLFLGLFFGTILLRVPIYAQNTGVAREGWKSLRRNDPEGVAADEKAAEL